MNIHGIFKSCVLHSTFFDTWNKCFLQPGHSSFLFIAISLFHEEKLTSYNVKDDCLWFFPMDVNYFIPGTPLERLTSIILRSNIFTTFTPGLFHSRSTQEFLRLKKKTIAEFNMNINSDKTKVTTFSRSRNIPTACYMGRQNLGTSRRNKVYRLLNKWKNGCSLRSQI